AGVDTIWVGESWGADAITLLAVLAEATTRVRLGSAIVNTYSRSPAALAQHFATLDQLSGGRMVIGLGTSGPQVIEHFHGVPYARPLSRLREYIEIINTLMRGEPLHHVGPSFTLDRGFTFRGLTPLRNHIPIHVGAMAPASVRQTARIADGWLPGATPRARWAHDVAAFRADVAAAGRDPASVEIRAPGAVTITAEPEPAYERSRANAAFYMARMGDLHHAQYVRAGLGEEADAVRRAWREHGSAAAYAALPMETVHALGYAGDVPGAIDWIEAQRDAGYDLCPVSVDEPDAARRADVYRRLVE
ncbi:MAG: LLM class flavin-dependent oxidoreductase, partial [Dehalococcoidia bacterium]